MNAEEIARQWRDELGFVHTKAARARGELLIFYNARYGHFGAALAFADYHLRKDGQITIYAIAVAPEEVGKGRGRVLIKTLQDMRGATSILAKCVEGSVANGFFLHMGFELERVEEGKKRRLCVWKKML